MGKFLDLKGWTVLKNMQAFLIKGQVSFTQVYIQEKKWGWK